MDILSLLSPLQNERLHFSSLKDLRKFDENEGTGGLSVETKSGILSGSWAIPSTPETEARNAEELARVQDEIKIPVSSKVAELRDQVEKWDQQNSNVFISCWHANELESDFMWRVYANHEYGFAVISGIEQLVECFKGIDATKIGCGFIIYPHRDQLIHGRYHCYMGSDSAFLIKHPEFSAENEFRVFVRTKTPFQNVDLQVDLQKLVGEIRISPLVPDWAAEALLKTLNPICERKGIPRIQQRTLRLRQRE